MVWNRDTLIIHALVVVAKVIEGQAYVDLWQKYQDSPVVIEDSPPIVYEFDDEEKRLFEELCRIAARLGSTDIGVQNRIKRASAKMQECFTLVQCYFEIKAA